MERKKRSKNTSLRMYREQIRVLSTHKLLLEKELEVLKKSPMIDKEIVLRLLEVVYAAKGGIASWGRR